MFPWPGEFRGSRVAFAKYVFRGIHFERKSKVVRVTIGESLLCFLRQIQIFLESTKVSVKGVRDWARLFESECPSDKASKLQSIDMQKSSLSYVPVRLQRSVRWKLTELP